MHRRTAIAIVLLCGAAVGLAQMPQAIEWQRDPARAVAQSQQTKLPIMFWVLGSSSDRDSKLEHDQRQAFADPDVVRRSQRYITARLSRSVNRDILEQLKLPRSTNMEIVFVSPSGDVLDRLSPSGVARASSLAQKMKLVFDAYRQRMFTQELQPILEKPDATPDELRDVLERVRSFNITVADAGLIKLLDRKGLDRKTERLCCEVLGGLSTKAGVDRLLTLSAEDNVLATDALAECTPAAAEMMLESLEAEDEQGKYIRLDVYNAVTKICRIKTRKSEKWWARVKVELRQKEIERVTELVKESSKRWKEQNEDMR